MQDIGSNKGQTVKIIDFENIVNEFLCNNQFKVEGVTKILFRHYSRERTSLAFEQVTLYYNPMESGIDQLMRYANRRNTQDNEGGKLSLQSFMVSTHRDKGIDNYPRRSIFEWKDPYP